MRLFRRRSPSEGRHRLGAAVTGIPSLGPAVTGLPSLVPPVAPAAPTPDHRPEPLAGTPAPSPVVVVEPADADLRIPSLAAPVAVVVEPEAHFRSALLAAPVAEPPARPVAAVPPVLPPRLVPLQRRPGSVGQPPDTLAPDPPAPPVAPAVVVPVSTPTAAVRSSAPADRTPVQSPPGGRRVQLGFRDGTCTELDPASAQSLALCELAESLTRRR